ncbi:helix-turn-helix transcriptional regulator [Nocardioides massiliensis]|uniref:Excisionase family DNA binding protein n=1 Tax=Nocardioides massiliensis TaxID=1325935 RepID=A0ABT9NSG6_9ACTN|nr:helix-turn-helix domain-containing protein [Nocardioides massiliensis]MDP9822770.1 excisionase family DNA binding protein [Nocardioides massiliensis]
MSRSATTTRKRLVSITQAADYAACSPKTIRRYISAGRLAGYRMGSRLIRVDLNELEAILRPIPAGGDADA